jgi:hypothetical protein
MTSEVLIDALFGDQAEAEVRGAVNKLHRAPPPIIENEAHSTQELALAYRTTNMSEHSPFVPLIYLTVHCCREF